MLEWQAEGRHRTEKVTRVRNEFLCARLVFLRSRVIALKRVARVPNELLLGSIGVPSRRGHRTEKVVMLPNEFLCGSIGAVRVAQLCCSARAVPPSTTLLNCAAARRSPEHNCFLCRLCRTASRL